MTSSTRFERQQVKKLKTVLQQWQAQFDLGGERGTASPEGAATQPTADITRELQAVIAANQSYFAFYWVALVVVFLGTVVLAVIFRAEMGGMATVLGAGGVVQGGLVLQLAKVWREKARTEMAAILASRLPPPELKPIIELLLDGLKD